ncbi:MAG: hypothetical protein ABI549_13155 [Flavobacterium sp.]|uniref:hypothetical protein n=1 Tax=Flavobacterium sp. TaxID=239 RepID=UPI003262E49A
MEVIIGLVIIVAFVFLMRAFGAWMLRIDDVIFYQKEILRELKNNNSKPKKVEFDDNDETENIEMDSEVVKALRKANQLKK